MDNKTLMMWRPGIGDSVPVADTPADTIYDVCLLRIICNIRIYNLHVNIHLRVCYIIHDCMVQVRRLQCVGDANYP